MCGWKAGDTTYRSPDAGARLVLAVDPELLERGVAEGRGGQRRGSEGGGEGLHLDIFGAVFFLCVRLSLLHDGQG